MNNTLKEYLNSPENTNISVKAHRSVLRRYISTLNGSGPSPDSAICFLKNSNGLTLTSLGTYRCILQRFLSWSLGRKIKLDCPWIIEPLSKYLKAYNSSEPRKQARTDHMRENYVFSRRDGKAVVIKGNKRDRPDNVCELCDKLVRGLDYHHWDDGNLMRGIWLCRQCHMRVAELIDKDGLGMALQLIEKYVTLKTEIDLVCGKDGQG